MALPLPHQHQRGLTLAGLLVIIGLVVAVLFGSVLLYSRERARARDAERIVHLTQFSTAMRLLYSDQASYADAAAGCGSVGTLMSSCSLETYLPEIGTLKDPGRSSYQISEVPSAMGFAVVFTLEQGYGSYAPGRHVLTQDGVR